MFNFFFFLFLNLLFLLFFCCVTVVVVYRSAVVLLFCIAFLNVLLFLIWSFCCVFEFAAVYWFSLNIEVVFMLIVYLCFSSVTVCVCFQMKYLPLPNFLLSFWFCGF